MYIILRMSWFVKEYFKQMSNKLRRTLPLLESQLILLQTYPFLIVLPSVFLFRICISNIENATLVYALSFPISYVYYTSESEARSRYFLRLA